MRRFLVRDDSGLIGEGVEFSTGYVACRWILVQGPIQVAQTIDALMSVRSGLSVIWVDLDPHTSAS